MTTAKWAATWFVAGLLMLFAGCYAADADGHVVLAGALMFVGFWMSLVSGLFAVVVCL